MLKIKVENLKWTKWNSKPCIPLEQRLYPEGGAALTQQFIWLKNWWEYLLTSPNAGGNQTGTQKQSNPAETSSNFKGDPPVPEGSCQHPWRQHGLTVKCRDSQQIWLTTSSGEILNASLENWWSRRVAWQLYIVLGCLECVWSRSNWIPQWCLHVFHAVL